MDEAAALVGPRDDGWFEDLYALHHGRVLAYARRRTDDADDVVAEVFATAWRSRARVPDEPVPWLLRTASHHLLHEERTRRRRRELNRKIHQEPATHVDDPADSVAARQDASRLILSALALLSPLDQEVLRLAVWEQLATPEIAYVLGASEVAVRVRLHRATRRLGALLGPPEAVTHMGTAPTPSPCEVPS